MVSLHVDLPYQHVHLKFDMHINQFINYYFSLQLKRTPRPFPKLIIKGDVDSIDDFTMDNLELKNYNPYPKIKMDMAV